MDPHNLSQRGTPPRARGRPPPPRATARDPAPTDRAPRSTACTHPAETPRPSDHESVAQAQAAHRRHQGRRTTPATRIDLLRPGEAEDRTVADWRYARAGPEGPGTASPPTALPTGPPSTTRLGVPEARRGRRPRDGTGPPGRDPRRRPQRGLDAVDRGSGPGSVSGRAPATGPPGGGSALRGRPGRGRHATGPPARGSTPWGGPGRGRHATGPPDPAPWGRRARPGDATGPPDRGSGPGRRRARPSRADGPLDRGSGPGVRRRGGEDRRRHSGPLPSGRRITHETHVPPGAAASGTIRSGTARDGPPQDGGEQMKEQRVRGGAPARAYRPRSDRGEAWVTGRPRHRSAALARRHNKAVRVDRLREAEFGLQTFME